MVNKKKVGLILLLLYLLSKKIVAKPALIIENIRTSDQMTFDLGEVKYVTKITLGYEETQKLTSGRFSPNYGAKIEVSVNGSQWETILDKPREVFHSFSDLIINKEIRYIRRSPYGYFVNRRGNFTLTYT